MFAELAFAVAALSGSPQATQIQTRVYLSDELPWTRPLAFDYPEAAVLRGIRRGDVTLRCNVRPAHGALDDCVIVSETPSTGAFLSTAVRAAGRARLDPARWTEPTVTFSIAFVGQF